MLQVALSANTPPDKVTELLVLFKVPPHVEVGEPTTVKPNRNVSVNPTPSIGKLLRFCIVMVKVEEFPVPARIGFGLKALLKLAPGSLVKVAWAACVLLAPLVLVTAPAGMVLVSLWSIFIVTLMDRVQFPFAGRLPPLNKNEVLPDGSEMVPPQVPTTGSGGLATDMPPLVIPLLHGSGTEAHCGKLSLKAMPVSWTLFGLSNSTLNVEAEPPKTVNGLKLLTTPIVIGRI